MAGFHPDDDAVLDQHQGTGSECLLAIERDVRPVSAFCHERTILPCFTVTRLLRRRDCSSKVAPIADSSGEGRSNHPIERRVRFESYI